MKTLGIIIICLLVTFVAIGLILPRFLTCTDKPQWDSAITKMVPIESAIYAYKLNTGNLPKKLYDLCSCPKGLESSWRGPYLKANQLNDPWNRPYVYEPNIDNPNKYTIKSYGRDGEPWGEGYDADIYND